MRSGIHGRLALGQLGRWANGQNIELFGGQSYSIVQTLTDSPEGQQIYNYGQRDTEQGAALWPLLRQSVCGLAFG